MQFVPWRSVADWQCIGCGDCCKLYSVVINFHEWLKIVKTYGVERTASGLDRLFIKRNEDGSCPFLNVSWNRYSCGIQHMKPKSCQIWPFKVSIRPEYGYPNEAAYWHLGRNLFVYVDPMCRGVKFGTPTPDFAGSTLKEFAEIFLGFRSSQYRTTARFSWPRPQFDFSRLRPSY
jgi:Fe-S-cluster containining protein